MTTKTSSVHYTHQAAYPGITATTTPLARAGLFILFLGCGLAIFLFGPNYYKLFVTNGNNLYSVCLSAAFLVLTLLLKRSKVLSGYWQIAYAFFIASTVNIVSNLFIGHITDIFRFLGVSGDTNPGLAIGKLYDTFLVVITILGLTLLSGARLDTLFIKSGNLKLGLGIGSLVFLNLGTAVVIFFQNRYSNLATLGAALLYGLVFSLSNGFLEELWLRGLFLKKLQPHFGVTGAILMTTIWYSMLHIISVAYLPAAAIPIFLINTFTLGLACGYLMVKTDSLWGSVLIHAGADLYLFVALLAFV